MIYRFGAFELDEDAGELRHRGTPLTIQPKPMALLQLLLRERHRIVSTEEILEQLWPDTVVTSGSLTRAVSLARRSIGDTHRGSVLRSFARRGYRFCGDVTELGAAPTVKRTPRAVPSAVGVDPRRADAAELFVGRRDALAALHAELEDAMAERGGLAWVVGPPGIGKTRLVDAFAEEVSASGPSVLVGRAREGEGVPAFWPWTQVMRRLLGDEALGGPVREQAVVGGELAALLPELGESPAAPTASAEQRRFLLFDAVARTLTRCGRERPLVVALEDIQWAGDASLRLVEHLAFELRESRVLLVVTVRAEPRHRSHPVERTLSLLRRQPHGREVPLRGFSRSEVAQLLERVIGRSPPADLTSELYARTEGVPLFLREALRLLAERGDLRHPERITRQGLVLPAHAFDFIRRGLDALTPETLTLVEAAAVLGREFPLSLLSSITGVERDEALDRLDEAERVGVTEPSPDAPATWRFVHALFQEAARSGSSTARRARLHQTTAERLEEQHREDPEAVIQEVAHHLHEGLAVGDPEHAFEVASRAASRAQYLAAWEQAAIHLEQAAAALEHLPAVDLERRLHTWLALGEAYRITGNRERRREVFGRARDAARAVSRPAELARAAIGLCDIAEWSTRDPVAEAALREALVELGDAPSPIRPRLLTRLAYQDILDPNAHAEALAREAVERARETGDADTLQEAVYTLHFAIAGPDCLEERELLVNELVETCRSAPPLDTTVIALIDVACDRIELGDAAGAQRLRAEAERLAGARPHPGMVWHMRLFDAGVALMEGRLDDAQRITEDALWFGRRIGHPYARPCYDAHRVGLARARGAHAEVIRIFEPGLEAERGATHYVRAVIARALSALGRRDEAREHFGILAADAFSSIPRNIRWTNTVAETAHLCADLADEERAGVLLEVLAPVSHHHGVLAVPVCYGGPVAFARARLLALRGEGAEALSLLEEAASTAAALGARPIVARIALERGTLHARRGEHRRARESLEEARRLGEELGMPEIPAAAAERPTR